MEYPYKHKTNHKVALTVNRLYVAELFTIVVMHYSLY